MTTPTHPQQEYIITEDQLQAISWALEGIGVSKNNLLLHEIRSRPHSSAQSRDQVLDEIQNELNELGCFGDICCLEYMKKIIVELRTQGSRDP